jgi:hypothetical protein
MSRTNCYFVPGYGISRIVIQSEIQYMCGPDAIVRPFTLKVCTCGEVLLGELLVDGLKGS